MTKSSPESPAKEQPGEQAGYEAAGRVCTQGPQGGKEPQDVRAPDVAAMVGRLREGATVLDETFHYQAIADTMEDAAALIEKLGQGWIPASGTHQLRIFKPCQKHKDIRTWTVHPSDYAIPAMEVCPVCEEIAWNVGHLPPPERP